MLDHRAGLELLRLSLRDMGSPWASVVDAVVRDAAAAARRRARRRTPAGRRGTAGGGGRARAVRARRSSARTRRRRPSASACRCPPSREPAHERVPLGGRPLRLSHDLRRSGHCWRYRYDKFGWTTRSSQLYENRLLRIGSPLFHFGILGVVGGHVIGLLDPAVVDRRGRDQRGHLPRAWPSAVGAAGRRLTVVGMAILIYRRRTVGPVFSATTRMDKVMYVFLAVVIVLGHVEHHRRLDHDDRRRVQLPRGRVGLVPRHLLASTRTPP